MPHKDLSQLFLCAPELSNVEPSLRWMAFILALGTARWVSTKVLDLVITIVGWKVDDPSLCLRELNGRRVHPAWMCHVVVVDRNSSNDLRGRHVHPHRGVMLHQRWVNL